MRRLFALAMTALLAMTIAVAVISCAKKDETTSEMTSPPVETMPPDTSMFDTTAVDTSMHH